MNTPYYTVDMIHWYKTPEEAQIAAGYDPNDLWSEAPEVTEIPPVAPCAASRELGRVLDLFDND